MSELESFENRQDKANKLNGEITWAWETWVESFEDLDEFIDGEYYKELGFESGIAYVRDQLIPITDKAKLMANYRQPLIQILTEAGYSNRSIAGAIGLSEATVRRDIKALTSPQTDDADEVRRGDASNEVDAAGQSVEEVGHIDDDSVSSPFVPDDEPPVVKMSQVFHDDNQEPYSAPNSLDDRFAGIDFSGMVISVPSPQIIETAHSPDTSDYFVPRSPAPSWSPPQVTELPPPSRKAYHEQPDTDDVFLEPPLKLQKVGEDKKEPADKHCKTCACNLLP